MGYKIIDRQYSKCVDDYRLTIIADEDKDIRDLPLACVGSTVIVADRGNEYIANTEGKWVFKSGDESRAVKYVVGAKEIAGTWQFNDELDNSGFDGSNWNFDFMFSNSAGIGGKSIFLSNNALVWGYDWDGDGNQDNDELFYDGFWASGDAPTLTTSATVDRVENGEALLAWLNANATKIAEAEGGNDEGGNDEIIGDEVIGTWKITDDPSFPGGYYIECSCNFKSNGSTFSKITAFEDSGGSMLNYDGGSQYNSFLGGWENDAYKTIEISSYDGTNPDLEDFLAAYATKIA